MILNTKAIKHAMIDAEMNNQQLSAASGVSITRISNIINGRNTTYETACKIAKALNINVNSLMVMPL